MDRRFLRLYNEELRHLRHSAKEFAEANPDHARRLRLDVEGEEASPDPYVERLLEGFAFLTARVQLKLDAEFPRLTQSLLETIYPDYLTPTPSMAVVRFEPDHESSTILDGSLKVPRHTVVRTNVRGGERTSCSYRTAHEVPLAPVKIMEAGYFTSRNLSALRLPPGVAARGAIRLRLRCTAPAPLAQIRVDRLVFHLRGGDDLPWALYEEIIGHAEGIRVQEPENAGARGRGASLPKSQIEAVGFRDDEALFPDSPRSFQGYRLLREYFNFPERFLFFSVSGLAEAVAGCRGQDFDLIVLLDRARDDLAQRPMSDGTFQLFCTPVINLLERNADRVRLSQSASEFRVVVDNTRAMDYEIYQIKSVRGYGMRAVEEQEFRPFYSVRETDRGTNAFYSTHRLPLMAGAAGDPGEYRGSDVYVSLVDAQAAPYRSDLQQLGVSVLCTNRHLPCHLARGGSAEYSVEESSIGYTVAAMTTPTLPRAAFGDGELAWRLVSHLSLNYFSLMDSPHGGTAAALKQLLQLYVDSSARGLRRQIEGIQSVTTKKIVRPAIGFPPPMTFARGLEITVTFDESAFEGSGFFVLGAVLEQFFARYVTLNSFTETVIRTPKEEIMRWKAQPGRRSMA
jgi:type VI secretion system protein ImpG